MCEDSESKGRVLDKCSGTYAVCSKLETDWELDGLRICTRERTEKRDRVNRRG